MTDPFAEYRTPQSSFTAVTGTDGRSLTLTATDVAQFHTVANAALEIANRHGWRAPNCATPSPVAMSRR